MQNKIRETLKKLIIFVFPVFFFYGCGVWTNFTTYFNLYYNSSDLFNQAETEIKTQNKEIFSTDEKPLPTLASTNIQKVIEKCSQILQFHSQSSFVDDALLMLGKCFYYQDNYEKGLRKFNELLSTQPNSDLVLEADLWIGKTQMKMKNYDSALVTLKNVVEKGQKDGNRKIVEDAYVEEIKYRIIQQDYSGAISLLEDFLKVSRNSETNAQAAYELGLLYVDQGDLPNAIKSFKSVNNYSPTYEVQLNSEIELGKTLRENGEPGKALDIFNSMRSQAKYMDAFNQIEVQKGITLYKMNRVNEAVDQLVDVDTLYSRTPSAGLAEYELAKIFETEYKDFDSASVYYNKALTNSLPEDYVKDARNKVDLLKKYHDIVTGFEKIKKDILYVQKPEEFVKDSVAYVQKQSELEQENRLKENRLIENRLRDNPTQEKVKDTANTSARPFLRQPVQVDKNNIPPQRPVITIDSLQHNFVSTEFELGNILFTEFNLPDSAYRYYDDIVTNHPKSKYEARALYALGSYFLVENDTVKADSLFNIIYNNYKNENIVNAAANKLNKPFINLNYDSVETLYSAAEKQLDSSKFDSSLINFYAIFKNHPKSVYAAKALYASGWVLENKLNLVDSAAVVYDTLAAEYPASVYSKAIMPKLSFYKEQKARLLKQGTDSLGIGVTAADSSTKEIRLQKKNIKDEMVEGKSDTTKNASLKDDLLEKAREKLLKQEEQANPDTLIRINRRFIKK